MARDHFIPAAYLGRFSSDENPPSRNRRLTVLRPGSARPHHARASAIGFTNGLYDIDYDTSVSQHGERFVDALWDEYEPRLGTALDMLDQGICDLDHWINVLVPFVGALLVRDRRYGERIANAHRQNDVPSSFPGLDDFLFGKTNMNMNRILGRNRFIGRLLVSDWIIGETSHDLCTSDLGYGLLLDQVKYDGKIQDRISVLVPASKRTIIVIRPEPSVRVLERRGGQWGRRLNKFASGSVDAVEVNNLIGRFAQDFVAGSEQAVSSLDSNVIATNSPKDIQAAQEYWPYRIKSADLAGIWSPLRHAVDGLPPTAIGEMPVQPLLGITDRFQEGVMTVDAAGPTRLRPLKEVISMDSLGFIYNW